VLSKGDVLVVNDAATIPASLSVTFQGQPVELRLAARTKGDADSFVAVAFGAGDHHTRTEDRALPPVLVPGDRVVFAQGDALQISSVDQEQPRLLTVRSAVPELNVLDLAYRHGRAVQYSYVAPELALYHVQTAYAGAPFAFEMPSAGWALTWELMLSLRRAGVVVCVLTHAAGLSSTGDAALDARLPLPEAYLVPPRTVHHVQDALQRGRRVVAVGTSVVRALETVARAGYVASSLEGTTDLRLGPDTALRAVTSLLTGLHDPGTSHFELLRAFADQEALDGILLEAQHHDMLGHEFGDALLVHAKNARRP
jgi:S-adenosylmethionine:tRNA ribosyltransferase-isomerase